jgi:hypothetical protein
LPRRRLFGRAKVQDSHNLCQHRSVPLHGWRRIAGWRS